MTTEISKALAVGRQMSPRGPTLLSTTKVLFLGLSGFGFLALSPVSVALLASTDVAAASETKRDKCASLTAGVTDRIEKLRKILTQNAKDKNAQAERYREEHRTVTDLNSMLVAVGCKALDIDYEVAHPPKSNSGPPILEAPAPPPAGMPGTRRQVNVLGRG